MYHDQYTRRRTADSFYDESLSGKARPPDDWSWRLFAGIIIIQVTGRCLWASFGVISFFLLRDAARPWDLLWTPVTFTATWALAEPWVKFFCDRLPSPLEFTYVTVVGVAVSWFGILIAVKCPLTISHFVPLLGVLGGLGASFAIVGCESLALKHFPKRNGAIRTFGQAMTSSSVFSLPILSFCLMNNFGEHGGLLLHGCVLMQSFIGVALIRGANWTTEEFEPRGRAYTFIEATDDPWPAMMSERKECRENRKLGLPKVRQKTWRNPATEILLDEPDISFRPQGPEVQTSLPDRQSMKHRFLRARRKRRKKFTATVDILPKIVEVNENPGDGRDEECMTDLKRSLEELNRLSYDIIEARETANLIAKPPRTFQHYRRSDGNRESTCRNSDDNSEFTCRGSDENNEFTCRNSDENREFICRGSDEHRAFTCRDSDENIVPTCTVSGENNVSICIDTGRDDNSTRCDEMTSNDGECRTTACNGEVGVVDLCDEESVMLMESDGEFRTSGCDSDVVVMTPSTDLVLEIRTASDDEDDSDEYESASADLVAVLSELDDLEYLADADLDSPPDDLNSPTQPSRPDREFHPNGFSVHAPLSPQSPRPASPFYTSFITSHDILMTSPTSQFRSKFCCLFTYLRYGLCDFSWRRCWFAQPLLLPAVFLLFSIHFSVLGFMALTPTYVHRVVDDVSDEDSAFTVCLMGFTWLSFVIASPCFSTIHFANHHIICLVALSIASLSCYLLSEAQDQDEMSLYSCMFGVSQGISHMTAHSVLKLSLSHSEFHRMRLALSVCVPLLMALTVTAFGSLEWFLSLRNSYKLFSALLIVSAVIWWIQYCITSVRRSQNGIRWSRRRRVS